MASKGFDLQGKTCVVTGGGSGIGRGIARLIAAEGGRVAVLDRNLVGAQETCALIEGTGGEARAYQLDVTEGEAVFAVAETVRKEMGPVWGLVNNAGVLQRGGLTELSVEEWNQLFAVNLTGYLLCAQAFGRPMLEAGEGSVVHLSSIGARNMTAGLGAYSITKAGVVALSHLLSVEWGPRGVRSNVILPGLIRTPLAEAAYDSPEKVAARASAVPLKRIGTPEDLGEAALFLLSPRASYVTGAEIAVDGGVPHGLMGLIPRF